MSKPELVQTEKPTTEAMDSIAKPEGFDLDRFKSKRAATMANVETLPNASPHHTIAPAKDFVRLHPDERYWSSELSPPSKARAAIRELCTARPRIAVISHIAQVGRVHDTVGKHVLHLEDCV